MANSVEMPELGESVTEGTITTWLKEVGDLVERYMDDPVTHSTDEAAASVSTMGHHLLLIEPNIKKQITARIASRPGRTVIFARTKLGCERIAGELRDAGVAIECGPDWIRVKADGRQRAISLRTSTGAIAICCCWACSVTTTWPRRRSQWRSSRCQGAGAS